MHRKIYFFFIFIFLFYIFSFSINDKLPFKLTIKIDKNKAFIGEKINYIIEIIAPSSIELFIPKIEKLGNFSILSYSFKKRLFFGKRIYKSHFILENYNTGEQVIPSVEINYRNINSKDWEKFFSPQVKIEIKSLLNFKEKDIRDIHGPKKISFNFWIYFLIFIAAFLVLLIIKHFRFKKEIKENKKIPAYLVALKALEELENKNYIFKGELENYYIELSDIVRYYFENRFSIRAPEMTTEEFLNKIKNENFLSLEQKSLLEDFLSICDLVKFAKYKTSLDKAKYFFDLAKKLIEETKDYY